MQTVRAVDANRNFSNVLKQVSKGEEFLVISRGKPVAIVAPVRKADNTHIAARDLLFQRLHNQEQIGERKWTRNELYERSIS